MFPQTHGRETRGQEAGQQHVYCLEANETWMTRRNGIESEGDRHQRREIQEERMTKKQLPARKTDEQFFKKTKIELLYDLAISLLHGLKAGT